METRDADSGSKTAEKGHSIDQHGIEGNDGAAIEPSGQADSARKEGGLPLETGNQYTHHKPEKK